MLRMMSSDSQLSPRSDENPAQFDCVATYTAPFFASRTATAIMRGC